MYISSLMYILKLNHEFAILKAVQTRYAQYRIDKYTYYIYIFLFFDVKIIVK